VAVKHNIGDWSSVPLSSRCCSHRYRTSFTQHSFFFQDYDAEMRSNDPLLQNSNTLNGLTLMQSNPRDWANLLSPPTVFPSVIDKQVHFHRNDELLQWLDLGCCWWLIEKIANISVKEVTRLHDDDEAQTEFYLNKIWGLMTRVAWNRFPI